MNFNEVIALIKETKKENPDIELLMKYEGSSFFKEVGAFNNPEKDKILRELLTPQEYLSVKNTGLFNSHYTTPETIYTVMEWLIPQLPHNPTVLDVGCGATIGWLLHSPPFPCQYTGVEICPFASKIAKAIAKAKGFNAQIWNVDFCNWNIPTKFDAWIGNIPFCSATSREINGGKYPLHYKIIDKGVQMVKPQGLIVIITTIFTLDSYGSKATIFRSKLAKQLELIKAIRLPPNAHIGNTEVTSDLLIFRRK
jgi:SAM-dependent methyltransferase